MRPLHPQVQARPARPSALPGRPPARTRTTLQHRPHAARARHPHPPQRKREMRLMRWGLVPHWAKNIAIGSKLINARVETLAEKPAFRDALKYRRCLLPADGFYEWREAPAPQAAAESSSGRRSRKTPSRGGKQPYYIRRPDGQPFLFAGLHEHWQDAHGNELDTCTIITTDASPALAPIHPRMPLILPPALWHAWLDPGTPSDAVAQRLTDAIQGPGETLDATPVSHAVNHVSLDAPELLDPLVIPRSPDPRPRRASSIPDNHRR
ncbi:MAG: SOS response-associated peptidase [Phycisphaeraceae bacterium]|nr:SOS response-associated peptidase [Phycisphaeraceae bacterium]